MITKINFVVILFLLCVNILYSQNNFRIYPSTINQTEPVITFNPLNPAIMFASDVIISGALTNTGIYISTNSGITWFGHDTLSGSNVNPNNNGGDPSVMIDKFGNFVITHVGNLSGPPFGGGLYSHFSTNQGLTWNNTSTITTTQVEDKGSSTVDYSPISPYYGYIFTAFVNQYATPHPLVQFSSSSNSGQTWSSVISINAGNPNNCSGGSIRVSYDGKIYVTWAGMTQSPIYEIFAGFASSSNAGVNWNVTQNVFSMHGIFGTLNFGNGDIRVNGLPQVEVDNSTGIRRGWIYIITSEKNLSPAGSDPDIILHRSTDEGVSWSNGIRVNQDPINNGKVQYFPSMCIDSLGGIDIIYYDNRNSTSDSVEVFIARSKDGGNSWFEKPISDHKLLPQPIFGGASNFQGDKITAIATSDKIYMSWMDKFSGIYQIWLKIVDLSSIDVKNISTTVPDKFELLQNYPNPFNPSTKIQFRIQKSGFVKLDVFDINGRLLNTPVNQTLSYGTYEINYSGESSGIYFYRLTSGNFTQTKKMIMVK